MIYAVIIFLIGLGILIWDFFNDGAGHDPE